MVRVKICGLTNRDDALAAVRLGADAVGFVFAQSPRQVTAQTVSEMTRVLPPFVVRVGVFVNESADRVKEIMHGCALDWAQLHGEEGPEVCERIGPERVIKAFCIRDERSLGAFRKYEACCVAYLLDTFHPTKRGGSGEKFPWELARSAVAQGDKPIVLSGGLTPDNVAEAVRLVRPYAVDVSSGVESEPGRKDEMLMKRFIGAAKGVER